MNSGEEPKAVQHSISIGVSLGIDVTPAFVVNGELHVGAPAPSRFNAFVDSYLARAAH
jgi:protein-disulfide isomerase